MRAVIVTLREQADVGALRARSRSDRERATIEALRATADRSQTGIRAFLAKRRSEGKVSRVIPLWIFNGLAVTGDAGVIKELAARGDVRSVSPDATIPAPALAPSTAPEWGVDKVNAPALWNLGFRGQGVVVASMDTGVDVNHPDLVSRWRGGANSWYDPYGQHPTVPTDVSGHGTATMGVIVGGEAGGTGIGVAPDAEWIAVKMFNDSGQATTSAIHQGFQWLLDPDGNPATPDAPDVVNNSWDFTNPGCDLTFEPDLAGLQAAGILPVFAAGNSGPTPSTTLSPANNPDAFAVGATDSGDLIFSGSGRGPSACGEPQATFPELVAPGVGIRSSDLYGGYAVSTGTSLAAPHASGVLALLLSAFPDATPDQQASALENSAVDLGAAGADNTFGYGRLDGLAAYNWLDSHPDFTMSVSPNSASTLPGGRVTYTVSITPANGFANDVTLSLRGLSLSQASWAFTPATVSGGSGSAELSVSAAGSLPPGTYPFSITGTDGSLTRSVGATLVVDPPPDFTISTSPQSASTLPGGSVTYTVSIAPSTGFGGDVALSLGGLSSSQASWAFSPTIVGGGSGSAELSVLAAASSPPGSYPFTITGTSGGLTRSVAATLVINPPPDFTIAASPFSVSTFPGGSATYTVSIASANTFNSDVTLTLQGLSPAQASWAFTPGVVSGGSGSAQLTVTTSSGLPPGSYGLTIRGAGGGLVHTTSVMLAIRSAPSYALSITPSARTVRRGSSTTYTVTVSSQGGYRGKVGLTVAGVPPAATASFKPASVGVPGSSVLTVKTGAKTPRGTYTVSVGASATTAGAMNRSSATVQATVTLTVT